MPAPATISDLLDLIQRSGVSDGPRIDGYLRDLAAADGVPDQPARLAELMRRDGFLTDFQSDQLLQGKWKRFTIGKYKVMERLGAGGMGQVFLCEHKLMRRRVAVKVLPATKAQDASSLERFYREARAVAALDHPNIVRAYDIDEDDGIHYLVMEYVDGTNLQDLIKRQPADAATGRPRPLDWRRACLYIHGTAVGLQHAHEMGLVHRDIKPGNILIDRAGTVKLLDMGLARFFHDDGDDLTRKYDENVLGTADYLAPEQAIDSHTADIRADIYSLGGTFYYLLAGRPPFPDGSVAQKLLRHQTRPAEPIRNLRPDVPEGLATVLARMLAKDAADRYQTPAELAAALAPFVPAAVIPPGEDELPRLSRAARTPPQAAGAATGRAPAGRAVAATTAAAMPSTHPPVPAPVARHKTASAKRPGWVVPTLVAAAALVSAVAGGLFVLLAK